MVTRAFGPCTVDPSDLSGLGAAIIRWVLAHDADLARQPTGSVIVNWNAARGELRIEERAFSRIAYDETQRGGCP